MNNISSKKQRILGLDIAKIFASSMVVLMHTLRNLNPNVPYHPYLYYFTRASIPVFFICLGYVQLHKTEVSKEYIRNKVYNIVSVSLAWIIIYDVIYFVLKGKILIHRDIWGWILQKGSFSIFWFMATMVVLYIFLPKLIQAFHGKYSNYFFILLLLLCVFADIINLVRVFYFELDTFWQAAIPQPYRLWTWIFYFYAGGVIRKYEKYLRLKLAIVATVLTSVIAVTYEYYMCYVVTRVINAEYMYDCLPVIVWSISLFSLFLCIRSKSSPVQIILQNLAGCLIPIYAIHYQILRELKYMDLAILKSPSMELICYFAVVIICIVVGLVMSRVPLLKKLTII